MVTSVIKLARSRELIPRLDDTEVSRALIVPDSVLGSLVKTGLRS